MDGFNWVIEVYNGTTDVINEKDILVNKDESNKSILALNEAIQNKDEVKIAQHIEGGVISFLEDFPKAAQLIVENK